ncbi:MAG: T9SS type A sorting domain-containing protein, partial [Candidatus Krumholzibacteria bacterium]|nr:T9SS type A sorting domain-containing protein [Candidatus Krumholzibacteria bacterium]
MDQLVGTCTAYGFTTTGIPVDYDITKYYDRDLGNWSKGIVIDEVNTGTSLLCHAGHSNLYYAMRLGLSDVNDSTFTNDGTSAAFPIVYTYGCYAGSFDNRATSLYYSDDCIGEEMVSIEHCAVALIGNSRYGWFTEGTTNGPSNHFQREFLDAVFTETFTTLGAANQRSKDETAPFVDLPDEYEPGAHRWVFYNLNLLGDPALDVWTDTPESLGVSHKSAIGRNDTLLAVEADVPGAVASLYVDGMCYGRGTADPFGHIYLYLSTPLPDTIDSVELNVHAHNHYPYRDTLSIVESTASGDMVPAITLEQNVPNPFNPSTTIRFSLSIEDFVDLRVYDVAGREVDRLLRGRMPPGAHSITWCPTHLSSGLYLYVLRTGDTKITRKAVLLR